MRSLFIAVFLTVGCASTGPGPEPEVADDAEFLALIDGSDVGSRSDDEEPQLVRLGDFSAERPTKLIMLVAAAGWCGPCQVEAGALNAFAEDYADREVVVLTALIEDVQSDPATVEFARLWAREFSLTVPVLIDSEFQTRSYIDLDAMPSSVIIDASTLEIRNIGVGADTGSDPFKGYRALLDHELSLF